MVVMEFFCCALIRMIPIEFSYVKFNQERKASLRKHWLRLPIREIEFKQA
jgi:hypothetical protein